jgi:hypothetical protein
MIQLWLKRVAIVLVAAFVVTYGGDWAIYKLRGSPTSTVTVNRFLTVPLKGNKIEYDYIGTAQETCSVSLFPQAGQSPCWHLRRNPNQTTNL